jgi:hypothetical protein
MAMDADRSKRGSYRDRDKDCACSLPWLGILIAKECLEKEICVTGTTEEYNGKRQIVVTEPGQIEAASK